MLLVLWLGCNATPPSGKDTPDTGHADSGGDSGAHDTDSESGDSDSDTGGDSAPVDSGDSDSGGDSGGSSARTIEVCGDGTGDYIDLPEAVAAADWGDTIELCPGTYTSPGYMDHYVSIIGTGGSASTTIVSCGSDCFTVVGFYAPTSSDVPSPMTIDIEGVTLDANGTDNSGLYVWSLPSLSTAVRDVVITGIESSEPVNWVLVRHDEGDFDVDGLTIVGNSGGSSYVGDRSDWGAFHVDVETFTIKHVTIAGSEVVDQDVVFLGSTGPATFTASLIVGNSGWNPQYLIHPAPDVVVSNITVAGNDLPDSAYFVGDASYRGMVVADNATFAIDGAGDQTYSLYSDNTGYDTDVPAGTGDLYVDPLFTDPASGDYTLQPASPAIDAGDPDAACNDADGSRNDMGAFGGPDGDWSPSW